MSILQRLSLDVCFLSLVILVAAGCQGQEPATNKPLPGTDLGGTAPTTVYAYTLLVPSNAGGTLALARVVIEQDNAPCPALVSGADSVQTILRQAPALGVFSGVTVCEALVGFDKTYTATLSGSAITLQPVTNDPSQVLVYGDTGCKGCSGAASPFNTLATAGAGLSPNLILHMGDYNYRGTSGKLSGVYDAGDDGDPDCQLTGTYLSQNSSSEPENVHDNWTDWQLDFFEPAKDLLPAAPWVFARGNHELCSRAGPGWFYFLGPGSNNLSGAVSQYTCPDQSSSTDVLSHVVFIEPYRLSLGSLRVLVMDSANACDRHAPDTTTAIYGTQFAQLATLTPGDTTTWLMTHRPLWGVDGSHTINHTMRDALRNTLNDTLPSNVTLSLAGHMHYFQSMAFPAGGRPPQLVIGNSGVSLYGDPTGCVTHTVDNMQANVNGVVEHGFLNATLNTDGTWSGDIVNYQTSSSTPTTVATCGTAQLPNAICTLASPPGGQGCTTSSP